MSTVEEPVQAVLAQADDLTGIDIGAQKGAIRVQELRRAERFHERRLDLADHCLDPRLPSAGRLGEPIPVAD